MSDPNTKSTHYCSNCYTVLAEEDTFCSHCGQKDTDGRVTVSQLIRDFFDSVLNLDLKLLHTLRALFRPAALTEAHFLGKQKRYVPPVRLFFIMAVVQFAILGTFVLDDLENQVLKLNDSFLRQAHIVDFRAELDTARIRVEQDFKNVEELPMVLDSLEKLLPDAGTDSLGVGYIDLIPDSGFVIKTSKYSLHDIMVVPIDTLVHQSEVKSYLGKLLVQQTIRLLRNGGSFTQYAVGKLIWMAVLMMPALALLLKLLYVRREYYYVEHLVFSFHYHAFAFLIFSVTFLINEIGWVEKTGLTELVGMLAWIWVMIYLYKAMRNYYKQNRFRTIAKFMIVNFSYLFIFILFLSLTFITTVLMF